MAILMVILKLMGMVMEILMDYPMVTQTDLLTVTLMPMEIVMEILKEIRTGMHSDL